MPKHVFQDSENLAWELLKPGVYAFKVMDAADGIQKAGKTAGSDFLDVKIAIGDKSGIKAQWTEKIIFHPNLQWKTDTFLKSINFNGGNMAKGQEVDVCRETIVGCRGHAKIIVETYEKDGEPKEVNKVGSWMTDQAKLDRDMKLVKEVCSPAPAEPDPFDDGEPF